MYVGKIAFCFASVRPYGACAQQNSRKNFRKCPQTFPKIFSHVPPFFKKGKALFEEIIPTHLQNLYATIPHERQILPIAIRWILVYYCICKNDIMYG